MSRSQRVLVVVIEHPLSWGDEKQRSFLAAPRGLAARLVLEDDALRRQLVADAVGCGEVAALARFVAAGDGVLDRRPGRIVALVALEPNLRILLEEAKEIAGGDERGGMARGFRRAAFAEIDVEIAQMLVHARQGERRVDVVAQRVEDGTRIARPVQRRAAMPDRAEPEIEAVERLLRLRHAFAREFERLAVMAASARPRGGRRGSWARAWRNPASRQSRRGHGPPPRRRSRARSASRSSRSSGEYDR